MAVARTTVSRWTSGYEKKGQRGGKTEKERDSFLVAVVVVVYLLVLYFNKKIKHQVCIIFEGPCTSLLSHTGKETMQ